ncbi:MAG: MlaD family protein [Candidatus Aminicenantes bacterium]|nr:MlaD family protein [Candidatus Aminicenantes bacterium]
MISKEQKTRLTVFSLASLALFILFLALLVVPMLKSRGLRYVINFTGTSVNGLVSSSPVKYQGVEVGKVSDISVHPDDLASIRVRLELSRAFPVKKDMTATLAFGGITGSKFIELAGGSNGSQRLPPGGEILTARGLSERAEDIVTNIDTAVRRINNLLGPENQTRISAFLENTEKSAAIISGVLEAKRENLANAITNIEKAANDFGAVTENLRKITGDLSGLTSKLDANAGDALGNLTKRFSDEEMGKVLRNLESFIEVASSSLKKIENIIIVQQVDLKSTVESMSAAVDNLSKLSRDLMEDPTMFLRNRKGKK